MLLDIWNDEDWVRIAMIYIRGYISMRRKIA